MLRSNAQLKMLAKKNESCQELGDATSDTLKGVVSYHYEALGFSYQVDTSKTQTVTSSSNQQMTQKVVTTAGTIPQSPRKSVVDDHATLV